MEKEERQSPVELNPKNIDSNISSFTDNEEPLDWYFNWKIIILSFFIAGPLALLLLWFRPKTALKIKIIITTIVLALTFWMMYGAVDYYQTIADYYEQLELQMKNV